MPNIGVLFNGGNLNGAGLIRTIRILSAKSDRHASDALPLVRHKRAATAVHTGITSSTNRAAACRTSVRTHNTGQTHVGSKSSLCLHSVVNGVPDISFAPRSRQLISNSPKTHHAVVGRTTTLLRPKCVRALRRFAHVTGRHTTLLGRLGTGTGGNRPVSTILDNLRV